MNYSLKIKLLELTQRALMVRADAQPDNGDKWRTTETGSKILLGKDGTVKGGMGGKFNGKNIKEVGGTKKFTKYQTNKEREQKNEPTAKREPAKPYAKNTDSVDKIMGSYDFGQAMHTTTLELADKIKLAESTLKGEKNGGTDKQKQSLSDFKQVLIDRLHSSHADDKKNEVERR